MKKQRVGMLLLAGMMGLSCTACDGGGGGGYSGDADDVQLIIQTADLGYGTMWLEEFNERFMQTYKDKDYGNGSRGVYIQIDTSASTHNPATMSTEGTHLYIFSGEADSLAASGNLLALDEIVTEEYDDGRSIEAKIFPETLEMFKATDGKYYTIPAYEVYSGIYYDVELFDRYGFYFADTRQDILDNADYHVEFESTLLSNVNNYADVPIVKDRTGSFFFVNNEDSSWVHNKSVGPDGKAGTLDDGLPSTIYEFIVLCERMCQESVQPMQISGEYANYANMLMDAVMAALQGPEKMEATYTMEGTVEVVTSFSNENLVGSIDYLKKPITKEVEITEESGYYTTWQLERYYAEALVEILETEPGFFADGSSSINGVSHLGAQENFIFSGYSRLGKTAPEVGMFSDGSHWWNEARTRGTLNNFYKMNPNCTERKLAYMSLPTNVANRVTGEDETKTTNGITESVKGKQWTTMAPNSGGNGACTYVNKKVANDSSVYAAVKDWLQLFYSDAELSNFTAASGFMMLMDYDIEPDDYEKMSYYEKDLYTKMKDSYVYRGLGCATTQGNATLYARGYANGYFSCCGKKTILECFRADKPHSTMYGFEKQIITMDKWDDYYKGNYPDDIEVVDDTVFVKKYS